MPIFKGNVEIDAVYKGNTKLDNVKLGTATQWVGQLLTANPTITSITAGSNTTNGTVSFSIKNNHINPVTIYYEINDSTPDAFSATLNAGASGSYSITNLSPSTNYTLYVYALETGQIPSSVVSAGFTTLALRVAAPTITVTSTTTTSVNFSIKNNDTSAATVRYEIGDSTPDLYVVTIGAGSTVNYSLGSLEDGTSYTIYAQAEVSGKITTLSSRSFTTTKLTTANPSISVLSTTSSSITYRVTYNDARSGYLRHEINDSTPDIYVYGRTQGSTVDYTQTGLTQGVTYTIYAIAYADRKNASSLVSITAVPVPPSPKWDTSITLVSTQDVPGYSRGSAFSPDGTHLVIAHNGSPYISIFKRSGDTFTQLANPSALPTSDAYDVEFSSDGVYLAVGVRLSPFINIYKRSGDTFTKLANPSTLPTGAVWGTSFSPDGVYLSAGHVGSPYVTIYKRSGDTFTKLANPSILHNANGRSTSFSIGGTYLAFGGDQSTTGSAFNVYKRSGDTFTRLALPVRPNGDADGVSFSPNGDYVSVTHSTSPFLTIYKRSEDTFTKLSSPSPLPPSGGNRSRFSNDNLFLAVGHVGSPSISIYKRSGDSFTRVNNPPTLPSGNGYKPSFTSDGIYLAVPSSLSPEVRIYKTILG